MNALENVGLGSTYFSSYCTNSSSGVVMARPFDNTMGYVIGAGGISASTSRFNIGNGNWISMFRPIADWTLDSPISQWNTRSVNLMQFDTTDWFDAPTLAVPADSTLPATLNVKVACDEGLSVVGNDYTLLSGCDLT